MRALVTGGASGIGEATVRTLRERGWAATVADLVPSDDGVILDVADPAAWERVVGDLWPLDALVNCAGTVTRAPLLELEPADFEAMMSVHLRGSFLGVRTLARRWRTEGRPGSVVNVSSITATHAVPGQAHYVAAKGAVSAFTRAAAVELADDRIRVNAVAPGTIRTPMTADRIAAAGNSSRFWTRPPMGHPGEAQHVATAIAYLLSADAAYCTGTVLAVDGGWSAC